MGTTRPVPELNSLTSLVQAYELWDKGARGKPAVKELEAQGVAWRQGPGLKSWWHEYKHFILVVKERAKKMGTSGRLVTEGAAVAAMDQERKAADISVANYIKLAAYSSRAVNGKQLTKQGELKVAAEGKRASK
jgi:hypothetical protein